jgi:formate hydrogenlyase subunit 3/multisubunit Na+/H+ antiporter MnhD subunit
MTMLLMISLPLLLAIAALSLRLRPVAITLGPWSALPALGLALWSPSHFSVELPWLFLGMHLGLDEVGRFLLVGTTMLWALVGVSARAFLVHDRELHRFFIAYLVALSGNLGLFMAQDIPTFALCYVLLTFSAYGLIVCEDTLAARRAGRMYLILVVLGDALLGEAILLITAAAGSQDIAKAHEAVATAPTQDLILALLLIGFGIKIGMLPFHMWMPLAYSAAPIGASAVLSGSMVLAGFFGCIRLLPLGGISLPGWDTFCITTGTIALFYGVFVGMTQTYPRTILAYSTISQVGVITAGLGIGMLMPEVWPLILGTLMVYTLHHALVMGTLFLGLGVAKNTTGLMWPDRLVGLGLLVPALSLAGAPLTSGALAMNMFQTSAAMTPWAEQLGWGLTLAAIGTAVLMGRFLILAWPRAQVEEQKPAVRLTTGIRLPWAILILCGSLFAWVVPWRPPSETLTLLSPHKFWQSLWPILVGGLLVWGIEKNPRLLVALSIPPGDIVVWAEWLIHLAQERWRVLTRAGWQTWQSDLARHPLLHKSELWVSSIIEEVEEGLAQWMVLGAAFLLLAALFLTLLIAT